MTHPDFLPFDTLLGELADVYETVAAMTPTIERVGGPVSGKPGSKLPPGLSETLDIDEHTRAVAAVDSWAEYLAHHLIDTEPGIGSVPDSTPGRLRLAARWADRLTDEPDLFARYAMRADGSERLVEMRRLSRRGTRRVRTDSPCLDVTCFGAYVAAIDGPEVDGDLVCSRCGDRVPHAQWSRWGSRVEWVTVEHAANMAGCTINAVKIRASRMGWRKQGTGRNVKYHADDVLGREGDRSA